MTPGRAAGAYDRARRRTLLNMIVTDYDEEFLTRLDPVAMADWYARTGASAGWVLCNSHIGLAFWPSAIARMHPGLGGRDFVGELVGELRARGLLTCAYFSSAFDNEAWEKHPEWRLVPPQAAGPRSAATPWVRAGTLCLNQQGYLDYQREQIADLIERYGWDCFFIDMAFWAGVCTCDVCRARYREETDRSFPAVLDWTSDEWAEFQSARERWAQDHIAALLTHAVELRPGLEVYSNFLACMMGTLRGRSLESFQHDTLVGADFYGERHEHLFGLKVMRGVAAGRPVEFITSALHDAGYHVDLKSETSLALEAFAATSQSCALMIYDEVNPDGSFNAASAERIARVWAQTAPYEPFLGGEHVEEIGIYWSDSSRIDLRESGRSIADPSPLASMYGTPHAAAVIGACRALQRAHLPFGIVTRTRLDSLERYRVIVVPNAQRLAPEEIDALAGYVERGGRLYASAFAGYVDTTGERHTCPLRGACGIVLDGEEDGALVYLRPSDVRIADAIRPQEYVTHRVQDRPARGPLREARGWPVPRLSAQGPGRALATLNLPFGYPSAGSIDTRDFAAFHTFPPHEDTEHPVIVENTHGRGRVIYSAFPLETSGVEATERLFVSLLRRLLERPAAIEAATHPAVWVEAFIQPDEQRIVVSLLNQQADDPPAGVEARLSLALREGAEVRTVTRAPDATAVSFTTDGEGRLVIDCGDIGVFAMIVISYSAIGSALEDTYTSAIGA